MKLCISLLIIFLCGVNTANNLTGLVEINPTYDHEWWKVWASLCGAILISAYVYIGSRPKGSK